MTSHDNDWYITQLNHYTEQLSPDDQHYFDDLRTYSQTRSVFGNELAINTQLYAMLSDFLDAKSQSPLTTAQTFFGDDPQAMANDLIKELPPAPLSSKLNLAGIIILITWYFQLFSAPDTSRLFRLNIGAFVINAGVALVSVLALFSLLHRMTYLNKTRIRWGEILIGVLFFVTTGGMMAVQFLLLPWWQLTIPFPWDIGLFIIAGIGGSVWFFRQGNPNRSISLVILFFASGRLLTRLYVLGYLSHSLTTRLLLSAVAIIGMFLPLLITWYLSKRGQKSK